MYFKARLVVIAMFFRVGGVPGQEKYGEFFFKSQGVVSSSFFH